jgi:hypothetical protein
VLGCTGLDGGLRNAVEPEASSRIMHTYVEVYASMVKSDGALPPAELYEKQRPRVLEGCGRSSNFVQVCMISAV